MNNLNNILNQYSVEVVLGDFNTNYFSEKKSSHLKTSLEGRLGLQQIVNEPTFVSGGTLLDHVYIKPEKFKSVHSTVISVYFSDHDAVKINFQL